MRELPVRGCVGDGNPHARDLAISLNGTPQVGVVLAFNVEAGWIRRIKLDLDGMPDVDWDRGIVQQETIRGRVEVAWK